MGLKYVCVCVQMWVRVSARTRAPTGGGGPRTPMRARPGESCSSSFTSPFTAAVTPSSVQSC